MKVGRHPGDAAGAGQAVGASAGRWRVSALRSPTGHV